LKRTGEARNFAREVLHKDVVCLFDAIGACHICGEGCQSQGIGNHVFKITDAEGTEDRLNVGEGFGDTKGFGRRAVDSCIRYSY
jgi:hypothetical protein